MTALSATLPTLPRAVLAALSGLSLLSGAATLAALPVLSALIRLAAAASTTSAASRVAVGIGKLDARSVLETQLAFCDDELARAQALFDHDIVADALRHDDGALFDRHRR